MHEVLTLNSFEKRIVDDASGDYAQSCLAWLERLELSDCWLAKPAKDSELEVRRAALGSAGSVVKACWEAANGMSFAGLRGPVSTVAAVDAMTSLNKLSDIALTALSIRYDDEWTVLQTFVRPRLQLIANFDVSTALVRFGRGDVSEALRILHEDVLETQPYHHVALCALAFIDQCTGGRRWRDLYGTVLSSSCDPQLRRTVLGLSEKGSLLAQAWSSAIH